MVGKSEGVFDWLFPILNAADGWLAGIVGYTLGRAFLWGLACGIVAVLLYWRLSPQQRIAKCKATINDVRSRLKAYDGEFSGARTLMVRNLTTSLQLLGLTLFPTMLSSLPVLAVLLWLSVAMVAPPPPPGSVVMLTPTPEGAIINARPAISLARLDDVYHLRWPMWGSTVELYDSNGVRLLTVDAGRPLAMGRKADTWSLLASGPVDTIPEEASVEAIAFELPPDDTWSHDLSPPREVIFLVAVMIVALGLKVLFKIQ